MNVYDQTINVLSELHIDTLGATIKTRLKEDLEMDSTELVEMAVKAGAAIKSLNVQNTTLDDVFVHYTGRQLRDELVKAHAFVMPPRPGILSHTSLLAVASGVTRSMYVKPASVGSSFTVIGLSLSISPSIWPARGCKTTGSRSARALP